MQPALVSACCLECVEAIFAQIRAEPSWVVSYNRVVVDVWIEVIRTAESNRILAQESTRRGVVVASAIIVEGGVGVELAGGVAEPVRGAAGGVGEETEGIVGNM